MNNIKEDELLPNETRMQFAQRTGRKPYPWNCSKCREQAVYGAVVDYTTKLHHGTDEYTITVKDLKTPKCVKCGQVAPDSRALAVLYAALRCEANILTPEQIRDQRLQSNLTVEQVAAALGVATGMVEGYEAGDYIQRRAEDNLMRVLFGFPQVREILTTQQIRTFPPATPVPT